MKTINLNLKEEIKDMAIPTKGPLDENTVEFIEELFEALDEVEGCEDYGSAIEYYDEFGAVLFIVDVGENEETCTFKFYESEYEVPVKFLEALMKPLIAA